MSRTAPPLLIAALIGLGLQVAPAQAQLSHTAVSALRGDDANNCAVSTPCRTFQRAHDATNDQGEITVLDPGGYGSLVIRKSISIVNDGVGEASILVSGGSTGITINGGAGAYVNLRGITIQGIGFGGGTGLVFNSGFALTMTNCVVRNHTGDGIAFFPSTRAILSVSDTLVADNGGHGIHVVATGSGDVKAVFTRVGAYNNSQHGIFLRSTTELSATVADSVAANNGGDGFSIMGLAPMPGFSTAAEVMVTRSEAVNNVNNGILATGADVFVLVGSSTITRNNVGVAASSGAVLESYGDNNIDRNPMSDGAPTIIAKK